MNDKFEQPVEGTVVVHKSGSGIHLTPEVIQAGRDRVAAGEDLDAVVADLVAEDVALEEAMATLDEPGSLDESEENLKDLADFDLDLPGSLDLDLPGPGLVERLATLASTTLLHQVADAHVSQLSAALRYAFGQGRKAISEGQDAVVTAVRATLEDVLPKILLAVLKDGGEAGVALLEKRLRTAEFDPNQPRDEQGQWTSGASAAFFERNPSLSKFSDVRVVSRNSGSAEAEQVGDHIEIGPKFWKLDQTTRDFVFAHEVGHLVLTRYGLPEFTKLAGDLGVDVWSNLPFAQNNMHEAFSDSFASYHTDREVQQRYPGWAKLVEKVMNTEKFRVGEEELRTAKTTPRLKIKMQFDAVNKEAAAWARKHAAEMAKEISATTRDRIRAAIGDLQEDGDFTTARNRILKAVGDADRADLIARHETMLATNEGQRQAWDQAVEKGLLTGHEKRVWIVTPDERLCPICESLEGQEADLDGVYTDDNGDEYDGPPAHVQCRCTEGIQ